MKLERGDFTTKEEGPGYLVSLTLRSRPCCLRSRNVVLKYESWNSLARSYESGEMSLSYDSSYSAMRAYAFKYFAQTFYICAHNPYNLQFYSYCPLDLDDKVVCNFLSSKHLIFIRK